MTCLLAVGICSSDEELAAKERQHHCNARTKDTVPSTFQIADRPKSRFVLTWNKLVAILPRRRSTRHYWTGTHDE
jgi:hypothetical protein